MKRKARKYQGKLTLYPMTFEKVVDTILAYKPKQKKKPKARVKRANSN